MQQRLLECARVCCFCNVQCTLLTCLPSSRELQRQCLVQCRLSSRTDTSVAPTCQRAAVVLQSELEHVLRGQGEAWSRDFLLATIKCDHGFTSASRAVQHFVDVLADMAPHQQRAFLRFVTGSPRLPPGGLAALRPQVTLVMKHGSSSRALPSDAASCVSPYLCAALSARFEHGDGC